LIWPNGVCSKPDPDGKSRSQAKVYLLVIVCSAVKNFEERQIIRDTWAKDQVPLRS
jgi:uncharacterized hydantoinase/oxoprolinase family protein